MAHKMSKKNMVCYLVLQKKLTDPEYSHNFTVESIEKTGEWA